MKKMFVTVGALALCGLLAAEGGEKASLRSPDGRLEVVFATDEKGLSWQLQRQGADLVRPSKLGLEFLEWRKAGEMRLVDKRERSSDTTWKNAFGRRENVRDHFNELAVDLEEVNAPNRRLGLVFRAYDEGVAFRYVVPEQSGLPGFVLMRELTEWRFAGDPEAVATVYGGHVNSQECSFDRKKLGSEGKGSLLGMPLLVKANGHTLALTEACLSNWAGHFYRGRGLEGEESVVQAELSPLPPTGAAQPNEAVIRRTPCESPWRVVICGENDLDLLKKNDLILNLNPPPEEGMDFSWVKPGATSWDWWVESNNSLSTELTLKLVDFAAEMGWPYHTIDGGWYGFARRPNHGPDVKVEPRPDFDLAKVIGHAEKKGVGIWVWLHWQALDDNGVDETLAKLAKWGVKGVKIDFMDRQDQRMVCWYEKVCRSAARHHVMVNFHGAHKPTGTERTWPNNLTREGIRGNEMGKFSTTVTPEHCLTLPFTRFLLGPADFTPGSFANVYARDFTPQGKRGHRYGDEKDRRPIWAEEIGTRAHAIAQCIAFDSPLMTLCDWPERYRGAEGVEALRNLPTVWRNTMPLSGECGSHYAVVRETFDGRFYLAALTVKRHPIDVKLDFLGAGDWEMQVFADDPELTPTDAKAIALGSRKVRRGQTIGFDLLAEGGAVAIFRKIGNDSPASPVASAEAFPNPIQSFRIRDPFVLVEGGRYYLYESKPWNGGRGVAVRESTDLENWTDPKPVMTLPATMDCTAVWAPEVHKFNGAFWLFTTLTQSPNSFQVKAMGAGVNPKNLTPRGTWVFKADSPRGPFVAVREGPIPPREFMTLDGTLYVEDGQPYMVYCHEWCQMGNGTIEYAPLKPDFTGFLAAPKTLLNAESAAKGAGCVTDGPFFWRSEKSGRLYLIWSNFIKGKGYCVLLRHSETGKIDGPWTKDLLLYTKNGGHGMLFRGLDGKIRLSLHQPNDGDKERMHLYEIEDDGQTLKCVQR